MTVARFNKIGANEDTDLITDVVDNDKLLNYS